jgi:thymidylate synthase
MNNIDKQYQELLKDILSNGVEKSDRTGTGTISVFGRQIRHKMSDGYPLLTTKKMAFKTMVTELLWFLKGDTNIKYLVDNGCNIWNGDAYKRYETYAQNLEEPNWSVHIEDPIQNKVRILTQKEFIEQIKTDDEFAKKWGELGPIYGKQWRSWIRRTTREEKIVNPGVYTEQIDQIQNLINELKNNPDSRRLMVNAWNVGELDKMTLPPCHYGFQVYTREMGLNERREVWSKNEGKDKSYAKNLYHKDLDERGFPRRTVSLMWNQRSVDTFLGLPFNIASYALLLIIIGKEVNMVPDELVGNLGDVHLYRNHINQAEEQIRRKPYQLPKILIKDHVDPEDFGSIIPILRPKDFILDGYECHETIKAPLSN